MLLQVQSFLPGPIVSNETLAQFRTLFPEVKIFCMGLTGVMNNVGQRYFIRFELDGARELSYRQWQFLQVYESQITIPAPICMPEKQDEENIRK